MKVQWVGGPLCGVAEEGERFGNLWSGPDPMDTSKVVIYVLINSNRGPYYRFSQKHTNETNARLAGP